MKALRTVLTMLGHGVGHLCDAGNEARVKLIVVVILQDKNQ